MRQRKSKGKGNTPKTKIDSPKEQKADTWAGISDLIAENNKHVAEILRRVEENSIALLAMIEKVEAEREAKKQIALKAASEKCSACCWRFECHLAFSEMALDSELCLNYDGACNRKYSKVAKVSKKKKLEIPEDVVHWRQRLSELHQEWKGGFVQNGKKLMYATSAEVISKRKFLLDENLQ